MEVVDTYDPPKKGDEFKVNIISLSSLSIMYICMINDQLQISYLSAHISLFTWTIALSGATALSGASKPSRHAEVCDVVDFSTFSISVTYSIRFLLLI